MSVNYNTSVLTSRLQQVVNAIDAGSTNGVFRLLDSGGNILSSLTLAKPCASVAGGVMTFLGLSRVDPSAAATNFASFARCEDSSGNIIISGLTVSTAGSTSDIVMSPSNFITVGQSVAMTAGTITGN